MLCSLVAPLVICISMLVKRAISRKTVLRGVVLVWIAGLDVYLQQILSLKAKLTPSLADDYLFSSELSMALYLLYLLPLL